MPSCLQFIVVKRGKMIDEYRQIEVFGDRTDERGLACAGRAIKKPAAPPRDASALVPIFACAPAFDFLDHRFGFRVQSELADCITMIHPTGAQIVRLPL